MDIFYPLQIFADLITSLLGLSTDSYLGSSVDFFVYDTLKIGLLLVLINYIMAITLLLSSGKGPGYPYQETLVRA
jgi:hypothetical protein